MKKMLLAAAAALFAAAAGAQTPSPEEIDASMERALAFIAARQRPDGSFEGRYGDTAAVPALAGMACLSKGYVPGDAKYGRLVEKAIDYIVSLGDGRGYLGARGDGRMYAHSIATLFLSEVSGMVDAGRQAKIDATLPKAVKVILEAQAVAKDEMNRGGWRYQPDSGDSDTSCSGWALMALRSARLNGARIPEGAIAAAVDYIRRHHHPERGCFGYQNRDQYAVTLSGAGILCLELCGKHADPDSLSAARYLDGVYRTEMERQEYRFYGMYYAAQGLFQIGGERWKRFSGWMYSTWIARQEGDGSWRGTGGEDSPVYATAMMTLAMSVPYRQLPIYQRDETVDE